jgi:predicted DCC family thiol-disulfide oxidoreductase YuxK
MGGAIGETRKQLKAQQQQAVLLYDGLCCLCNRTVHFLLRIDHRSVLHFAALQSTSAKSLLEQVDHSRPLPDGVVLIHNGKIYTESEAALKSLQLIGGIWKLLAMLRFIPNFIRKPIYRIVARNRYKWFGKYDTCPLPKPEWKQRFLD